MARARTARMAGLNQVDGQSRIRMARARTARMAGLNQVDGQSRIRMARARTLAGYVIYQSAQKLGC
jgi:hypothetical protein